MTKLFIAVLLLVFGLSACSLQVSTVTPMAGDTQSSFTAVASPTSTSLFGTIEGVSIMTSTPILVTPTRQAQGVPTVFFSDTSPTPITTVSVDCPAPVPRVQVSQQVTVTVEDWDKLKLRSKASLSEDTVLLELNQYTQLKILDGPVCVKATETEAFLFWKVAVIPSGEIGWVAEGDVWHYFIQ